jgi:hypothetical protein
LATPLAATFDVERALWVPRPIVTVPATPPFFPHQYEAEMIARFFRVPLRLLTDVTPPGERARFIVREWAESSIPIHGKDRNDD